MPVKYSQYREFYIQFQLGNARAEFVSATAPAEAFAGQTFRVSALIKNIGESGKIYANLVKDGSPVSSASQDILAGESYRFELSAVFPDALLAKYGIEAGHTIKPSGVFEDILDSRSNEFTIYRIVPSVEGVVAPAGATDVIVLNASFPIFFPDLEVRLVQLFGPAIASVQGITIVSIDALQDRNKILVWLKSPLSPTTASFLVNNFGRLLVLIGIVIISATVISLSSNQVTLQTVNKEIVSDVTKAVDAVQKDPNLTPEQKAAAINKLLELGKVATEKKIPWDLIIGGTIVTALVIGGAMVLSKPEARTFITERLR